MGSFKRSWSYYLARSYQVVRQQGYRALLTKLGTLAQALVFPQTYERWISLYDSLDGAARQGIHATIANFQMRPIISIIMPFGDEDGYWFSSTVSSIDAQLYRDWELCVSLGPSVPEGIREALHRLKQRHGRIHLIRLERQTTWAENANRTLELASGDFIVPLDVNDTLAEDGLYWIAKAILDDSCPDLIFSDEDNIDGAKHRASPWFKSDWNPALMLTHNAFGRLGAYRRSLVNAVGGFRAECEDPEYDLVLRCAEATQINRIRHIPRVLYHRRVRTVGQESQDRSAPEAPKEHLPVPGLARVVHSYNRQTKITYKIPSPPPRVSVIMATTARPDIAEPSFTSLLEKTNYREFELLVLVDRSAWNAPERAALLKRIARHPSVHIIDFPGGPFNYSAVNNRGAEQASGKIMCFLNDDTQIINADWLEILISRVLLPGVAAAGPILYYPNGTIQHAGVILGLGGIAGHACLGEPRGSYGYFGRACIEQDVSCVTAACMVIRADAFHAVGGFDEALPLAYNDVDLCLRLRSAGWRILWTPAAELLHRESASLGRHDEGAHVEQYRHDVAAIRKRWGPLLEADPFYNPNLSLQRGYGLAFPPRHLKQGE